MLVLNLLQTHCYLNSKLGFNVESQPSHPLTSEIENSFSNKKASAVLVDLTAAYDTVG